MKDIGFLYNRLKLMSAPEILYRFKQKAQDLSEKTLNPKRLTIEPLSPTTLKALINKDVEMGSFENFILKADLLCKNTYDIFALKNYYISDKINFHKDYLSGLTADPNKYSKNIDYRNSSKIGDVKYIWELNRQLYMPIIAIAWRKTSKRKYIDRFQFLLKEWIDQNPFLKGVNWTSSLELGIRLINWTICWHLLSDNIETDLKQRWLTSIYQHCWFISRNFSLYSSANNHLIGEAAGLFAACSALPKFKNSEIWREKAYNILLRECEKQNYNDGVNKEQAVSYQQFVLDFLLISGIIGKVSGKSFPEEYWHKLEKMLEYLASIENISGVFPQIGDEDFGYVVNLNQIDYGPYRSLLNTGAYIFGRKDFLKNNTALDDKTLFLANIGRFDIRKEPENTKKSVFRFDDGGYYILGTSLGNEHEQKLVFDCGPLGYLSIAAHGHADSLSFYFSAGGKAVFVDPGTYAYHSNSEWRNYFRGTSAHNTVVVDSCDQSVICGNFMWSQKAQSRLLEYDELVKVKGTHNGYQRLKDKVRHTREISYANAANQWLVIDELICKKEHTADVLYHIHPDCRLIVFEDKVLIEFGKGICILQFEKDLDLFIHYGDTEPHYGWYSPSYDTKVPSKTIRLRKKFYGTTKIVTRFNIKFY
ncbi:MAG: alginate lyase family protein [Bacillota bacterium]|nr:alginate lyase family protein [Bacillota bacterium]